MKMSIALIKQNFVQKGLNVTSHIMKGHMVISGVRILDAPSGDDRYAEIVPAASVGCGAGGAAVVSGVDRLCLPDLSVSETFNIVSEAFEKCNEWERGLYVALSSGKSLQQILDAAKDAFSRPMFIKSSSGQIKAISYGYPASVHPLWKKFEDSARNDSVEVESSAFVSSDPEYSAVFSQRLPSVVRSPLYGGMVLRTNIWLKDQWLYEVIVFANGKPFDTSDIHLMCIFAEIMDCYAQANADKYFSFSGISAFFSRFLESGDCGSTNLLLVYRTAGWSPEDELAVLSICGVTGQETPSVGLLHDRLMQDIPGTVVVQAEGRLICIADVTLYGGYRQLVARFAKAIPPDMFTWGVSYEFVGIERVPQYREQAVRAQEEAQSAEKRCLTMYDIACSCIAEKLRGVGSDFTGLIHPGVIKLIEKDSRGRNHYAHTLFEYLLCGGNYTDTARQLGIHRNSLIYRMGKIEELTGSDLSSPADRKLMLCSFFLLGY